MGAINIYVAKTEDFAFFENLPPYVKEKVQKGSNERVNAQKRAGIGLLHSALMHMGINADVSKCFLGKTRKPLHENFSFSVSHSSDLVCVAVSQNKSVGIDIEPLENRERTEKLKDKILNENEIEDDMLLLWTQKEAVFKYQEAEKGFTPKTIDTTKYNKKSISFFSGEKEFILSVVSDDVADLNFFLAPSFKKLCFKIIF